MDEYELPIDCLSTADNEAMIVTVNLDCMVVIMEINRGASLSIMSYSTFCSTWPMDCSADIKSSEAWLRSYTGEKISMKGAVDIKVNYEKQEVNLVLTIVEGEGLTLRRRNWLPSHRDLPVTQDDDLLASQAQELYFRSWI